MALRRSRDSSGSALRRALQAQVWRTAPKPRDRARWPAAASAPRGSRARSSSGRRRATRSRAVPRVRQRRSGAQLVGERTERPIVVRPVGDGIVCVDWRGGFGRQARKRRGQDALARPETCRWRARARCRSAMRRSSGDGSSTDSGQVRSVATTTMIAAAPPISPRASRPLRRAPFTATRYQKPRATRAWSRAVRHYDRGRGRAVASVREGGGGSR